VIRPHVDAIFSKIETLDVHKGIIALQNGVSIGHRKHKDSNNQPAPPTTGAGCRRIWGRARRFQPDPKYMVLYDIMYKYV
jgi:hypothetical protein